MGLSSSKCPGEPRRQGLAQCTAPTPILSSAPTLLRTLEELDKTNTNDERQGQQLPASEDILDARGPANAGAVHPRQEHWGRKGRGHLRPNLGQTTRGPGSSAARSPGLEISVRGDSSWGLPLSFPPVRVDRGRGQPAAERTEAQDHSLRQAMESTREAVAGGMQLGKTG